MYKVYKRKKFFLIIVFAFAAIFCNFYSQSLPVFSFDPQSAAFSLNAETKDINSIAEAQKIGEVLDDLENNWNLHKIEKVLKHYADDFINGDGLTAEAVKSLTLELWEAYPDIQTKSQERTIRVYGEYATVESTDLYQGNSSAIRNEVGAKGVLKAISMGEVFLKKFGPVWKVTSDKTIFEKVSIGYGLGSELLDQNKIRLSVPEQVASGQQYTAKLDFDLPDDIKPVAAISKELLVYPQVVGEDKFRLINEPKLERLLGANKTNKNELVTATIGLTGGPLKPKLLGLVFLSKRLNVIPISEQMPEVSIIKTPAKSALTKTIDLLDNYPNEQKTERKNKNNTEKGGTENKDLSPPADLKE